MPPSSSFNRLAWSNLAAQSADQIALAAAPLIAVVALGAGPGEAGMLQTFQTLPFLLFALPAGVLADRMARKSLMAWAEAARAAGLAAVALLLSVDRLSLGSLAVLGFICATGTVAFGVAAPGLVASLVPPNGLARANGRIELARTLAFVAGPAAGGALAGAFGGIPAFVLGALLSALAAALLGGLPEMRIGVGGPATERHPFREAAEGAAFVLDHALLRPVMLTQIVFNGAFFVLQAAYVPYAVEKLGLSANEIGWTLATYGAGMLVGAMLAPQAMRRLPFGWVVVIGPIFGFVASLVMAATIVWPSGVLAALSFFLIGIGPILWVIATMTLRQAVTPGALLGRVSSIFMMATGARPVGAAIGAGLAASYGMQACLVAATLGFALQAAIILASPVRALTR
jgi:predicted MFS family arabinose efflux permease